MPPCTPHPDDTPESSIGLNPSVTVSILRRVFSSSGCGEHLHSKMVQWLLYWMLCCQHMYYREAWFFVRWTHSASLCQHTHQGCAPRKVSINRGHVPIASLQQLKPTRCLTYDFFVYIFFFFKSSPCFNPLLNVLSLGLQKAFNNTPTVTPSVQE